MLSRTTLRVMPLCAALIITLGLSAGSAEAQTNPGDPGPLPRPQPYFGTKTLGNPPVQYPAPGTPAPDPVRYWRGRIISSGGYGSPVIFVVDGYGPCYVPAYYFGSDYYNGVSISYGAQIGGFQIGMRQRTGYTGQYVPGYVYGGYGGGFYGGGGGIYVYNNYGQPYPNYPTGQMERAPQDRDSYDRSTPRSRRQKREDTDDENDYYLHRKPQSPSPLKKDPALAQAVSDIEAAFRTRNIDLLKKHVVPTDKIVLQSQGRTRRSLVAADYLQMTEEALEVMKTARYELNHVEPASNGNWMVYGTHVLRTEDNKEKTFNVGFVLKKHGDTWVISEVNAEPVK